MRSKREKRTDQLIKYAIIGLILVATGFAIWTFLQKSLVTSKIVNQRVTYTEQMPKNIPATETIHAFDGGNPFANHNQSKKAIGQVAIPKVGLVTNVFAGLTNANLSFGAVSLFPDRPIQNHNVVLIGHNMGVRHLHFGALQNVSIGDKVYLRYLDHSYQYQVRQKSTIKETQIDRVADTMTSKLTLVTCSAATRTPNRILVSADLVKALPARQAQMKVAGVLKEQKQQICHDLWWRNWLPIIVICLLALIIIMLVMRFL
ncbi:class A sortase [Weissella confusa]|uniref:class A sortase n=1 Tax=Weissella confusa TaxID=1583 RepID=UPI0005DB45DE|nr:class A sortase [Weissella confusa]MBJ7646697.1 class A sortase [Weissella confusa]MBJ7679191.1 class A sortase [Weissella confusa]COI86116.1 sortase [Streptococcus pneumoniae]